MPTTINQPAKNNEDRSNVDEARDFWVKTTRWDMEHGKEIPVVSLGERADYDLKDEEGQKAYQMARYSCEATDELMRKARGRTFSFGGFTLRKEKKNA